MKKKRNKKQTLSITTTLKRWWQEKHPVLLFVLKFLGCYILFYVCSSTDYFRENLSPYIASFNAEVSNFFLNLMGQDTIVRNNNNISSSAFSIKIEQSCNVIEPMGLFVSNLLAFPARWSKRIIGVLVGVFALFAINIIRIDSLYLIGTQSNQLFKIMHEEVWQFVFIILALCFTFYWIKWAKENG